MQRYRVNHDNRGYFIEKRYSAFQGTKYEWSEADPTSCRYDDPEIAIDSIMDLVHIPEVFGDGVPPTRDEIEVVQ